MIDYYISFKLYNMREQEKMRGVNKPILEIIFYLTFRMLLQTSSEVTVNTVEDLCRSIRNLKYAFISDVCHRCLSVISDKTEMAKEKEYLLKE